MKLRQRKRRLPVRATPLVEYIITPKGRVELLVLHQALRRAVEALMDLYLDPEPDTAEGRTLAWMSTLLERVERVLFPVPEVTPIELARFRREMQAEMTKGPPHDR